MTGKLELRPIIETKEFENSTAEERFQTQTLRPVLKLQNELILGLFKNHIIESKNSFYALNPEKKALFIENSLQKNLALKNKLLGVALGMFTLEELEIYNTQIGVFNRRISGLIIERISSQIHLL